MKKLFRPALVLFAVAALFGATAQPAAALWYPGKLIVQAVQTARTTAAGNGKCGLFSGGLFSARPAGGTCAPAAPAETQAAQVRAADCTCVDCGCGLQAAAPAASPANHRPARVVTEWVTQCFTDPATGRSKCVKVRQARVAYD